MPRTDPGVTVASRVLAILGSFDAGHRALTLSEIARRTGLTLPTAHRLVAELAGWGALRRSAGGEYVIGRRLWDLGLLAPVQTGLRALARLVPAPRVAGRGIGRSLSAEHAGT